jgi:AcrR family transcriptional regulator
MSDVSPPRYRKPGWFTTHVFNRAVMLLTRAGISVWGSRVLEVAGRSSGQPRQVPVNLLSLGGDQYLVSARGTGQWVRNVRAADGRLDLLLGRTPPALDRHRADRRSEAAGAAGLPASVEGRGRGVLRRGRRRRQRRRAHCRRSQAPGLSPASGTVTDGVPVASGRPAPRERTARARQIIDAARVLLETAGSDGLTMRALGAELGIRAPSLYKHLAGRPALEVALVEAALDESGRAFHAAVAGSPEDPIGPLLETYRVMGLANPETYRLATAGSFPRAELLPGLEAWAGEPFFLAAGEPYLAQALWAFAHGTLILELDRRFVEASDLDRTWRAGADAFTVARRTLLSAGQR